MGAAKRSALAPLLWASSIQYFIVQIIVASNYSGGYSWADNTISDLGNTACGMYGGAYVCSPWHPLMNLSFILLGLGQAGGALLMLRRYPCNIALIGMVLGGLGAIIVGLAPENTNSFFHILGAGLPFILGNIGIALFYNWPRLPRSLKIYSLASGVIALLAFLLFITKQDFGLGLGLMERLVSYPQTLWLVITGTYLLFSHTEEISHTK